MGNDTVLKESRVDNPAAWQNYWRNRYQFDTANPLAALDAAWIHGKEIRIFRMPDVNKNVSDSVYRGIEDIVNEIGLDFTIRDYGSHESIIGPVKEYTRSDGRIKGDFLLSTLTSEDYRNPAKGGKPHADVIIVNNYLALVREGEIVAGDENWGISHFIPGGVVISVPRERQKSLDFIRKVSKHEASHLLGFGEHHDDPYTNVKGYQEAPDCNMYWRASTLDTCDRCSDALRYFWIGIQEKTGKQFLKT